MMKRAAAAVLYSVVAATGTAGVSGIAELNGNAESSLSDPNSSHQREGAALLEEAEHLCGEEIDAAFIAADATAAAAVAICSEDAHVSVVDVALTRQPPSRLNDALRAALDHCRRTGTLKIQIHLDTLPLAQVRKLAESRGFVFSKLKARDGVPVAEFYTDLYWSENRKKRA